MATPAKQNPVANWLHCTDAVAVASRLTNERSSIEIQQLLDLQSLLRIAQPTVQTQ